jgi:hypothetical protein
MQIKPVGIYVPGRFAENYANGTETPKMLPMEVLGMIQKLRANNIELVKPGKGINQSSSGKPHFIDLIT